MLYNVSVRQLLKCIAKSWKWIDPILFQAWLCFIQMYYCYTYFEIMEMHILVRHHNGAIMGAMASHTISLTIVYSVVFSGANQRKHQSSASLAFVRGTHRWPVNSPHKGPVTRKMSPFDDVIINIPHIIPQLLNKSDTGNIIGCPHYISYSCNHATINWLCFDYVKNNWKYGCGHGNKLDMSAARRRLKSSRALFSTSTHPTMVTFPFTSIRPTLPEILPFQNCQCHGLGQRSMLHSSSSIQPMHLLFVSSQLFTQSFFQEQIKWNIKAPRHWPLCGELTDGRWIPRTKGQ